MKVVLSAIVKVLNMLGMFKMTYDIGHEIGQSDGTETDPPLSTEENSLSNSQIAKIGGYILASIVLGALGMFAYKKFV